MTNTKLTDMMEHDEAEKHFEEMISPARRSELEKKDTRPFYRRWSRRKLMIVIAAIIAVIVAIVLILLFPVGRALAQKYANQLDVKMGGMDMTSFGTAGKTIRVTTSMTITHSSPFSASIDAATTDLYYNGEKLGEIALPAQELKSNKKTFDLNWEDNLIVVNQVALDQMAKDLISKESIDLKVKGLVNIHTIGMTYKEIKLDLNLKVKGMNGFTNPESTLDRLHSNYCQGNTVYITNYLTVNNNGEIGIPGAGALNLSVYYEHYYIGYVISMSEILGLPRGSSEQRFNMTVEVNKNTAAGLRLMAGAMVTNKPLNFYIMGNNTYSTKNAFIKEGLTVARVHLNYTKGYTAELRQPDQFACLGKFLAGPTL